MPEYQIFYPKNFPNIKEIRWSVREGDFVRPSNTIFNTEWGSVWAGDQFLISNLHARQRSEVRTGDLLMTISCEASEDVLSSCMFWKNLRGLVYPEFEKLPSNMVRSVVNSESGDKISIYVRAGLDEEFAKSIVNGADPNDILDLWEADWRKQYPSDDPLIAAILASKLTNEDGNWLNSKRSDHEMIVLLCADGHITIDFAKALLDSGFYKHPEAVIDVIQGAEPSIIARIRKIEINGELPPALEKAPPREYFD